MSENDAPVVPPAPGPKPGEGFEPRMSPLPWGLAGVFAVASILLAMWGIGLRSDRDDAQDRLAGALQDNAILRQQANATAYRLSPTEQGPANANAQAFFSLSGSGVLSVANMPQPEPGKVYQLWYLLGQTGAPVPGATFVVDEQGIGFMLIPADVGPFSEIAISAEPEGGSAAPTGPFLLTSQVSGARG